jgi:hypothetical protein
VSRNAPRADVTESSEVMAGVVNVHITADGYQV